MVRYNFLLIEKLAISQKQSQKLLAIELKLAENGKQYMKKFPEKSQYM